MEGLGSLNPVPSTTPPAVLFFRRGKRSVSMPSEKVADRTRIVIPSLIWRFRRSLDHSSEDVLQSHAGNSLKQGDTNHAFDNGPKDVGPQPQRYRSIRQG